MVRRNFASFALLALIAMSQSLGSSCPRAAIERKLTNGEEQVILNTQKHEIRQESLVPPAPPTQERVTETRRETVHTGGGERQTHRREEVYTQHTDGSRRTGYTLLDLEENYQGLCSCLAQFCGTRGNEYTNTYERRSQTANPGQVETGAAGRGKNGGPKNSRIPNARRGKKY